MPDFAWTPKMLEAWQGYLRGMRKGKQKLRRQLLPRFPDRYRVLVQPYVDEIRRLRREEMYRL